LKFTDGLKLTFINWGIMKHHSYYNDYLTNYSLDVSLAVLILNLLKLLPPANTAVVMFALVCLSVSLYVCPSVCHICALTFEGLDQKLHFWYAGIQRSFRIPKSSSSVCVNVIGSRSRSQEQNSPRPTGHTWISFYMKMLIIHV